MTVLGLNVYRVTDNASTVPDEVVGERSFE